MASIKSLKTQFEGVMARRDGTAPTGLVQSEFDQLEGRLGVVLPADVPSIGAFFSGFSLGYVPHRSWRSADDDSVLIETERLRDVLGLAHCLLALAETSVSVYVLDTRTGGVVACATHDVEQLSTCRWGGNTTFYPTYARLFAEMLTDEQTELWADSGKSGL